jgi:hypothetical protein
VGGDGLLRLGHAGDFRKFGLIGIVAEKCAGLVGVKYRARGRRLRCSDLHTPADSNCLFLGSANRQGDDKLPFLASLAARLDERLQLFLGVDNELALADQV